MGEDAGGIYKPIHVATEFSSSKTLNMEVVFGLGSSNLS